ncbi:MAG: DUF1801 domain-containing protein [Betaproteobacteria bacterium]|nr:DUF1801 domain-containing protein [Betaproteobacteria bacterium]
MPEPKTKPTGASVAEYIAARGNPQQQKDSKALIALFKKITKKPAHMWGPSIVGFGSYKYTYETGHSGEAPLAGFAIRGREIVVYLLCEETTLKHLLAKLGKHRMTKCCLYFKQLADLDLKVLEELVVTSIAQVNQLYPK